jgi:hypothetical protein
VDGVDNDTPLHAMVDTGIQVRCDVQGSVWILDTFLDALTNESAGARSFTFLLTTVLVTAFAGDFCASGEHKISRSRTSREQKVSGSVLLFVVVVVLACNKPYGCVYWYQCLLHVY